MLYRLGSVHHLNCPPPAMNAHFDPLVNESPLKDTDKSLFSHINVVPQTEKVDIFEESVGSKKKNGFLPFTCIVSKQTFLIFFVSQRRSDRFGKTLW